MKAMQKLLVIAAALCCLRLANLQAATLRVWPDSPTPGAPFDQWANAAHDIQTAVDAASAGDTVLVTNGVYATGGAVTPGGVLLNRVAVTKPITLQSVNGREVTIIQGQGPLGPDAVRCLYLTNGASVIGFTVTHGFTQTNGSGYYDRRGAGVFMDGGGVVSNCTAIANTAHYMGGGIFAHSGGNVFDTLIQGNQSVGYAGGIYSWAGNPSVDCLVQRCQILGNWANYVGGLRLLSNCVASACEIRGNWATNRTGGASLEYGGILAASTIVSNTAPTGNGGGVWLSGTSILRDSRVWSNSANFGGGVYCNDGPGILITNCDFAGNSATAGGAVRIFSNAVVMDCVFRGNHASFEGGAVSCDRGGQIWNSILRENTAGVYGGGAALWAGGRLQNCSVFNNVSDWRSGGVHLWNTNSTLLNCAIVGNRAGYKGAGVGAWGTDNVMENCIVWANEGDAPLEGVPTVNRYNCIQGWTGGGMGNIALDPWLIDSFHLGASSPCLGAGLGAVAAGVDLDGQAWQTPPAIGGAEFYAGAATGALTVAIDAPVTNFTAGYVGRFAADLTGRPAQIVWDFGDGTRVTNGPVACHAWSAAGDYPLTLTAFNLDHPGGVSATAVVRVLSGSVSHVNPANATPAFPYDSWGTAATNLQDAVDACAVGGTVLVADGLYNFGAVLTPGCALPSRVSVTKDITVQSANGPGAAIIQGQGHWDGAQFTNGPSAIRGVYLAVGQLSGFTLTGGFTLTSAPSDEKERAGGGAFAGGGRLTNCVVTGNQAQQYGGGVIGGTLWNCVFVSNSCPNAGGATFAATLHHCVVTNNQTAAWGGGVHECVAYDCLLAGNKSGAGGAAGYSTLVRCEVRTNQATFAALCNGAASDSTFVGNSGYWGGAANNCGLTNCTLLYNTATGNGGGVNLGILDGCTLIGNFATNSGGGAAAVSVFNSLILSNTALLSGGGLWNGAGSNYMVTNVQVIANRAGADGGGIYLDNGGAVWNSLIASNQSLSYGGGISLHTNGLVANCQILGNAASPGGGAWSYSAAYSGGGVWSVDASGVISNCVVSGCLAGRYGGGIYQGTVFNCQITNNTADPRGWDSGEGGGAYNSRLHDSTLSGNYATSDGGGMSRGSLDHCIVSGNSAYDGAGLYNYFQATNCLLTGNVGQRYSGAYQGTLVNCTVVGNSNAAYGVGYSTLINTIVSSYASVDTHECDAWFSCARELTSGVNGNITNAPVFANPAAAEYSLNFLSPGINTGTNLAWMTNATDLAGNPRILDGRVDMGTYEYNALQSTGAVSAVLSADYPVATTSGQVNLAAAVAGRAIGCLWQWDDGTAVSNVYSAGHIFSTVGDHTVRFTVWNLDTTNRVEFTVHVVPPATRYVSLAGAHTPPFTNWPSAATNIQAAVDATLPGDLVLVASGVYSNGSFFAYGNRNGEEVPNRIVINKSPLTVSSVEGPGQTTILGDFSWGRGAWVGNGGLLVGFTITGGYSRDAAAGGGVWCESEGTVSNCTIVGNSSWTGGGGVYGGTFWRCTISQNTADTYYGLGGGGALEAVLYNCLVVSNLSLNYDYADYGTPGYGGGARGGALYNCTVAANSVTGGPDSLAGSGTYGSTLTNCVVYGNSGAANEVEGGSASYSCLPTMSVPGVGNLTNDPAFLSPATGNYTPAYYSPCINAGTNADWMIGGVDLAGLPRIVNSIVDMGAYEYQGGGSPVIKASLLLSPPRLRLEWISVPGKRQQLQSAASVRAATWLDEGAPFAGTGVLSTNIPLGSGLNRFFRLQIEN